MRNFFSSRSGVSATVALLAAVAGFGATYLFDRYAAVDIQGPKTEVSRLRYGYVALTEITQLVLAVEEVNVEAGPTPDQALDIEERIDILYVRVQDMRRQQFAAPGSSYEAAIEIVEAIVDIGDEMIATDFERLAAQRAALRSMLDESLVLMTDLVNFRTHSNRMMFEAQARALFEMIVASAALLLLFLAISLCMIALLRAAVRAYRKLSEAEERAHFLAYYDSLTKLPNRARITDLLETAISEGKAPTLALVDLDEFKAINDTHGHDAGDALLIAVGERLKATATEFWGVAARLGGDEFVVMLPQSMAAAQIQRFCEATLQALRAPVDCCGARLMPRASVGVVSPPNDPSLTMSRLLKSADLALYAAKEAGRDQFVIFDETLEETLQARIEMQEALAQAFKRDELFLMFQPQIRLQDGGVVGFEALARWRRGGRIVPPGEFIEAAEESGQITELDHWGVRTAARQIALWRAEGLDAHISVNLSPLHFRNRRIVQVVAEALAETSAPAHSLTLEITETNMFEDWGAAADIVRELRALGVRIAVDDFGVGHASLGALRKLRIDELKIDRSIVQTSEHDPRARSFMRSIVELSHALDADIVAEGIETDAHTQIARDVGCDRGQGYLFSKPLLAEDARVFLIMGSDEAVA